MPDATHSQYPKPPMKAERGVSKNPRFRDTPPCISGRESNLQGGILNGLKRKIKPVGYYRYGVAIETSSFGIWTDLVRSLTKSRHPDSKSFMHPPAGSFLE